MNSEPVLVSLIGWPLFIVLVAMLIGWKWWASERDLREFEGSLKEKNITNTTEINTKIIGEHLGSWLMNLCKMKNFTSTQIALLDKAGIKIDTYYIELVCLGSFAAANIVAHAGSEEFSREVNKAFISEVRKFAAKETVISAVLDRVLVIKTKEYTKALPEELERDREISTSQIALIFLNYISPKESDQEQSGVNETPYYDHEGALIRPPQFKELEERIGAAMMLTDISMNYFYATLQEASKIVEEGRAIRH
jgi:hypothetical protein